MVGGQNKGTVGQKKIIIMSCLNKANIDLAT